MPKLNFISDDSIKDKIVSWQKTVAASIPSNPGDNTSDKQDEHSKDDDAVSGCKTDVAKEQNDGKATLLQKEIAIKMFAQFRRRLKLFRKLFQNHFQKFLRYFSPGRNGGVCPTGGKMVEYIIVLFECNLLNCNTTGTLTQYKSSAKLVFLRRYTSRL